MRVVISFVILFILIISCSGSDSTTEPNIRSTTLNETGSQDGGQAPPTGTNQPNNAGGNDNSGGTGTNSGGGHLPPMRGNIADPTPNTCTGCLDRAGNLSCDQIVLDCIESFNPSNFNLCPVDKKYCSKHDWLNYCTSEVFSDCHKVCEIKCMSCSFVNNCNFNNYQCQEPCQQ